jgi:hypothetical protein
MSHLDQYRQDLAWELTIDKNLNHEAITQRLDTLVELAKNAGKMELNPKYPDLKIDTYNPFMH